MIDALLLQSRFREQYCEWYGRVAQRQALLQALTIDRRTHRVRRSRGREREKARVDQCAAKAMLLAPFALHTGRRRQARPRPQQRAHASRVNFTVEDNYRSRPVLTQTDRARWINPIESKKRIGVETRELIARRRKQPIAKLPLDAERICALEMRLAFVDLVK